MHIVKQRFRVKTLKSLVSLRAWSWVDGEDLGRIGAWDEIRMHCIEIRMHCIEIRMYCIENIVFKG